MWVVLLALVAGARAGHMAYNTSDVITTYAGHADADRQVFRDDKGMKIRKESERVGDRVGERKGDKLMSEDTDFEEGGKEKGHVGHMDTVDSDYLENHKAGTTEPSDGIVFVPSGNNDAQSFSRRLGGGRGDEHSVKDMMERVAIGDVINERVRVETEAPNEQGVVFKPGKNNEQTEDKIKHELDDERVEKAVKEFKEVYENPIDCENLDCENVVESVCGVKIQNKRPKYRLFLNECYFRKVNCGLKYEYNRYRTAPLQECDGVGSHVPTQMQPGWIQYYEPRPQNARKSGSNKQSQQIKQNNKPPRVPSRRSLTASATGSQCDHTCPIRCPDEYAPVCAVTYPNRARVFQNHCLLDIQSCTDASVWQERPLAECAGMERAEIHERAAFIGWMQRMGILDKKGHLVMK